MFGKSLVDVAVEIDLSVFVFSSSSPFVCNGCYKRLLRFEKVKPIKSAIPSGGDKGRL